jgi:hypothetical protein
MSSERVSMLTRRRSVQGSPAALQERTAARTGGQPNAHLASQNDPINAQRPLVALSGVKPITFACITR